MKIEKISENKIKVTIPNSYFEERNIDFKDFNYNSPVAQELFCELMEQIESNFDFNFINSQVVIEASPEPSDDFVLTITKLDNENNDFSLFNRYLKYKLKSMNSNNKYTHKKQSSNVKIFSFKSFDDLCELANKVSYSYVGENTLFKLQNTYYLVFVNDTFKLQKNEYFENLFNEYGNSIENCNFYEGYLNEYGTKIIEYNALDTLNNYF